MSNFLKIMLLMCMLLLNVDFGYCQPISNLGAYNIYNSVVKMATNMVVTKMTNANSIYSFNMSQGPYSYNISLFSNEEGYVSKVSISTYLPMLAVNELLRDDKSSGRYYDETYDYLRKNGIEGSYAEVEAHKRAEVYARERLNKLETMFNIYGLTGDNVINSTGVMLLGKIREEDIEKSDYYTRFYYSPRDVYQKGIDYFYVNPRLMGIINSGLIYLYAALGLSNTEITTLNNSFNANSASVYCHKTNRTVNLRAGTTIEGKYVMVDLSAQ
ncbi:hypothetical protein [Selenomonas ruminantium]|uniref:hypothetical protein n=1 Tax=Selenomonas ruminantium TaxID=971 RepID=UPI00047B5782|nr:hypothetical protein [Selenomonas ruminantium]